MIMAANGVVVGWREWLALPELGIPAIKAKIDTGARTSALHTTFQDVYEEDGIQKIRFGVHPLQRKDEPEIVCETTVYGRRIVRDSGGHAEERNVIRTTLALGELRTEIELTLTSRTGMLFRMLLGRTAMGKEILVRPRVSYQLGRSLSKSYSQGVQRRTK